MVNAWDSYGNKSLPPVALTIKVAVDPILIKPEPEKTTIVIDNSSPVQNIPKVATVQLDKNKIVEPNPAPSPVKKYPLIKIGPYAGYFQPNFSDEKILYDEITKIYGKGNVIYGGRLGVHIWQGFYFWFSASQFRVIGKTTITEDKTILTLNPLSVFLRCSIGLGIFNPYAGIGFIYMGFKEESKISPNVSGNGSNIGYEGGLELKMSRHFFLDLGFRYEQLKVEPTGFEIDIGGWQAGVSLLVSF
jgi:hypothetical protein